MKRKKKFFAQRRMNGSAAAVKEHDVGNVLCFHRLPPSQKMRLHPPLTIS